MLASDGRMQIETRRLRVNNKWFSPSFHLWQQKMDCNFAFKWFWYLCFLLKCFVSFVSLSLKVQCECSLGHRVLQLCHRKRGWKCLSFMLLGICFRKANRPLMLELIMSLSRSKMDLRVWGRLEGMLSALEVWWKWLSTWGGVIAYSHWRIFWDQIVLTV